MTISQDDMGMEERPAVEKADIAVKRGDLIIALKLFERIFFGLPVKKPKLRPSARPDPAEISGLDLGFCAKLDQLFYDPLTCLEADDINLF